MLTIRATDLDWLMHAVDNVQTRTPDEATLRQGLIGRFYVALNENPRLPEFVMAFTPDQALLLTWAVKEGRCRNGDEWLTRGRLQGMFEGAR
jgi:hypothetical protein